jgi:MFS family permease
MRNSKSWSSEADFRWLGIVYTLAVAAVAPFAGATSDFMGRRYASLLGAAFVVIGMM